MGKTRTKKSVILLSFLYISRYLPEFFRVCLSHVCAKLTKKILAIAQSACQPWPISAKTLDASSDHICWDTLKRKKLVRFLTYWSNLLKGFFNISKKMAFLIFLKSLRVHPHDVHGWVVSQMSIFVYVGWVSSQWNVYVGIFFILFRKKTVKVRGHSKTRLTRGGR